VCEVVVGVFDEHWAYNGETGDDRRYCVDGVEREAFGVVEADE
jgi:hypothetical protein